MPGPVVSQLAFEISLGWNPASRVFIACPNAMTPKRIDLQMEQEGALTAPIQLIGFGRTIDQLHRSRQGMLDRCVIVDVKHNV